MKRLIVIFLLVIILIMGYAALGEEDTKKEKAQYSEAEKKYSSAYVYIIQGNFARAQDLLEEAIKDSTTYLDAYLAIWKVYLQLGEINKTRDILMNGLSIIPKELVSSGKVEEGEEARRKLTLALADLYAKLDDQGKANQLFKDIINENPEDADSYVLYAGYLEKQGKLDEVIMYYKKAHQLDPDNKEIALKLGDAYFKTSRYKEAVELFQQAKEKVLLDIDELLKDVESYQKLDPVVLKSHIDVLKKTAQAYMNLKEYRNAIQEYKKIIEIIPKHVSSRIEIGNAYAFLKEYSEAIKYYDHALELELNNLTVYYQLINMELSRGNLSEVKRYLDKGFDINSDDPILLALRGEYYYRLGARSMKEQKWNPALDQFNKAIDIWEKTLEKAQTEEWKEYAREGIKRTKKLIEEVKKVRW